MRSNRSKFGGRGFLETLVFFTNDLLGVPIEIVFFVFDNKLARKRSRLDFLSNLMICSCGLQKTRNDFDHSFNAIKSLEHRV